MARIGHLVALRGLDDALGIAALLQGEPARLLRVWGGARLLFHK